MRPETGILATQGPVARIRNGAGAVCGTGLLVGYHHVITCAHVVDDAVPARRRGDTAAPGEAELVTLDLPFLDRRGLTARVVAWHPMVDDVEGSPVSDIAVLELQEGIPGGLDPREAVLSAPSNGTAFTTLGFPAGMDGGAEAGGELRMRDAGGWRHVQDTQDHGYFVEPGFSGAPVFDAEAARHGTRRLLGMVVAADRDAKKRLAFVIPTPTLGRAWPLLVRPYKGLDAFEAEDADLFFGREEKIGELADKIGRRPFVALIGPSGSGKSSLVRAGLVPRLRAGGGWATGTFKPRNNPLYSLAEALASLSPGRVGDGLAKRATELADRLQAEPRHVLDYVPTALDAIPGAEWLLLVVDQFEELFTLAPKPGAIEDPATPHGAFAALLDLVGAQPADAAPVRVVATLRGDFTGHALRHAVFERLMTDADVKLGPMSPADLTDAVAKPAERFDVAFDPGLVSEIVARMRDSRGGLPLMQFALDRLWQRQENRQLTEASYAAIGGVEGALNEHAEAFRKDLCPGDQIALRRIMTRLVTLADPGSGAEDTRAVATRGQIGEADWDLVGRLAKARLVTTGGTGGEAGTETAEIAHEAMIRAWDTLRVWLDEDRTFALWRQRLRHDIERWGGTNEDALLRGELLADAEKWKTSRGEDLNDAERIYIDEGAARRRAEEEAARDRARAEAEKEQQQREERLRILEEKNVALAKEATARTEGEKQQKRFVRRLAVAAVLLVLAFLGAAYFGWSATIAEKEAEIAKVEAQKAQLEAQASAREALGRQLAAEARLTLSEIAGVQAAERTAALAIEAWHRHKSSQAYQVAARSMSELPIARVEHGGAVTTLAFSPDGTRLATGSSEGGFGGGTARILDAATGAEIARIEHDGGVDMLAFSPDGTRLATGSSEGGFGGGTARILDAATGAEIARIEHAGGVNTIAYSPDGTRLATGSIDGTARILDAATGAEIARIEHDGGADMLAFSPDGTRLATGSIDRTNLATGSIDSTARILDAATGAEIARIEHGGWVGTLAFSPDGTRLATGSSEDGFVGGTARILDAATGAEIIRIEHGGPVFTLAFSPDGTRLATGSGDALVRDGTARILDAATGAEIARIEHGGGVDTIAYSPDGTRLAAGSRDGTARILDAATGAEIARIEHGGWVRTLAFSPDGTRLATGSGDALGRDGTARILDAATSAEIARIEHGGWVGTLAFSPDGTRLATGSSEGGFGGGTARILDAATGAENARIEHGRGVGTLAFSPDGTRLATGSGDAFGSLGTARILDAATGAEIARIEHGGRVGTLAFSPDGTRLVAGSRDGTARILDAATGAEIARIEHGDAVNILAFSPDGTRLATGSGDAFGFLGTARMLDAATGAEIARIEHGGRVGTLAFSPDGTRLATGSGDAFGFLGTARILDAATGDELARIEHGDEVNILAFSPDGTRLATGSGDAFGFLGTARMLDAATGAEIARIEHGGRVGTLAFSPDGAHLATGSEDGTLRILDAATGDEIARIEHGDEVNILAFSPDGIRLATGSDDGTARILDADPNMLFKRLCTERAGRNLTRDEWRRYIGEDEPWRQTCPEWRTLEEISEEGQADLSSE